MAKYVKETGRIGEILKAGISSIDTNEERTIVKTPVGSYAFPTREFNKLGGYEGSSPLSAANMGLNLGYKTKEDEEYSLPL